MVMVEYGGVDFSATYDCVGPHKVCSLPTVVGDKATGEIVAGAATVLVRMFIY